MQELCGVSRPADVTSTLFWGEQRATENRMGQAGDGRVGSSQTVEVEVACPELVMTGNAEPM